ncbi:MAG: hypothetical protein Alpg2KO_27540 [Alphaproteobacteria bacterium]
MPKENQWDHLRDSKGPELYLTTTDDTVMVVNWADIIAKEAKSRGATIVIPQRVYSSSGGHQHRTIDIKDSLFDIYEQAGIEMPEALAKKLTQIGHKRREPETDMRPG